MIVTAEKEIKTTCTITLTSPIMREEAAAEGGRSRRHQVSPPSGAGCPGLTTRIFLRNIFTYSVHFIMDYFVVFTISTFGDDPKSQFAVF